MRNARRLVGLILIILFGACSPEPKLEYKLLLDWMANPNHVPLFVGVDKGIFAKHGVPIRILRLRDLGDSYPFLASGNADLALTTMPQALQAADRDFDIRYAASLIDRPLVAFIVLEDGGIKELADLNGKSLGAGYGGFTRCLLRAFQEQQLEFGEQRRVAFDLVAALATEQVDAILAYWNIEPYQLEVLGIQTRVFPIAEPYVPLYHDVIVVSHGTFDLREAFQAALVECIDYCQRHPKKAFEIYAQANPEKADETLIWEERAWDLNVQLLAQKQGLTVAQWQELWDWLKENGCDLAKEEPSSQLMDI